MIRLRICVFWESLKKYSAIFITPDQGYIISKLHIAVDVNFDHLAELVFIRFLHCKITFTTIPPPFILYILEESHYS